MVELMLLLLLLLLPWCHHERSRLERVESFGRVRRKEHRCCQGCQGAKTHHEEAKGCSVGFEALKSRSGPYEESSTHRVALSWLKTFLGKRKIPTVEYRRVGTPIYIFCWPARNLARSSNSVFSRVPKTIKSLFFSGGPSSFLVPLVVSQSTRTNEG